jgi:hypothetical protein
MIMNIRFFFRDLLTVLCAADQSPADLTVTVRHASPGSVTADAAVLQLTPEMEEYGYGQLRTVSKFFSKVFLQLKCDPGKDQAKCWGPIFPEGCRGVRGASSEIEGIKI